MLLSHLVRAWGNYGFAPAREYVEVVAEHARRTRGPVLECGSGLTTLVLAALAGRRGVPVLSLEHLEEWRRGVAAALASLNAPASRVLAAPLRDYGSFAWYAVPPGLPWDFRLIVCDGPPRTTKGGRYGLLPVLQDSLAPGAVILLDDADRPDEAAILDRGRREAGWQARRHGRYAVITVPGARAASPACAHAQSR
ncbi:MAG: class I SAM-dependent methyltransferase [Candidatus Rokubacteria bacterium]|nr:class I SAM-dependent methyltransferase [Candidatus Rokubacteria bacterium]